MKNKLRLLQKKIISIFFPKYKFIQDKDCPICMLSIKNMDARKMECNHVFHKNCIDKWLIQYKKVYCPVCRLHFLI